MFPSIDSTDSKTLMDSFATTGRREKVGDVTMARASRRFLVLASQELSIKRGYGIKLRLARRTWSSDVHGLFLLVSEVT
jgi:hypothetical protein